MVNERNKIPPAGLFDVLSRTDDLLILNRQVLLEILARMNGGAAPQITPVSNGITTVPSIKTLPLEELRKRAESGHWIPYAIHEVNDMSTATSAPGVEVPIEGDFVSCWCSGGYDGIGVRFNHQANPIVYFSHFNPIKLIPFWKLWLTYPAKTDANLRLFVGRQGSAQALPPIVAPAIQPFHLLVTDKDVHFTTAIAQNANDEENLTGLVSNFIRITGIAMQSEQQLQYELALFGSDGFENADLDLDYFKHIINLDLPTYGVRTTAGVGQQYRMAKDGFAIDYTDLDNTNEIHAMLINRSATAKGAGAGGAVTLLFTYVPLEVGTAAIAGGGGAMG